LISLQAGASGPISRLADTGSQAGSASSIDIARGNRVVTSCRTSAGDLKLISWDVAANGAITRRGDSANQAGAATAIKLLAISGSLFVTACRAGNGNLKLISWRLNANGSFTRLFEGNAGAISEVSLLKLPLFGTTERIVTAVRDGDGDLKVIVWRVSSTGAFTRLGDSGSLAGEATLIRSALDPRGRVVTSVRDGSGDLKLITWGISANGATVQRLGDSGSAAGDIFGNSLASLPDGVVSAVRDGSGNLKLIAWTVNAGGSLTRRSDSGSQAGEASAITVISDIGVNGLSMVTVVRTGSGTLKLIGWGPACVRLHIKIVQQPNIAINTMVTNMRDVYGSVGIGVTLASTETLTLPNTFLDIDVGGCSGATTTEQDQLFSNRNNAGATDVVVYFVRSTVPPLNGCASHPPGRPGAVVASIASQWTMAHEVGHVLGLSHVGDNNRLMTGGGTNNITNPPPDLVPSEVSTMQSSAITTPC
jgi:hypothetical protein